MMDRGSRSGGRIGSRGRRDAGLERDGLAAAQDAEALIGQRRDPSCDGDLGDLAHDASVERHVDDRSRPLPDLR